MKLTLEATKYLQPPPKIRSSEWLSTNVTMPEGTETGGMPFSLASFPHVDGVLDAFDDPAIRMIVLQWGTRLGKTTTCLSLMAKVAGTNPRNMMFAGSTKDAAGRVVASRLYPILASTDGVKSQLLSESRRSKLDVRLAACRIFIGWSGSETSLADVGAYFGVANEIDKWDSNASDEADSLMLFLNRFKGFTNHKVILESTPTIKGRSRIEQWMGRANQHYRQVPCPLCGKYQVLRKGVEDQPGGIKWERKPNGDSDAELAHRTAYYECRYCEGKIENFHRIPMLRRGVWVPDGCTVDDDGTIRGTAINAGSDIVGFGPLPSWYALTETWGSFARAWIRAQKRPRDLQDVVNSYMAETWEAKKTKSTPEKIAERITGQTPKRIVPDGGLFLTVTVDRQAAEGGYVVYCVLAHGMEERCWLVDWGVAKRLSDIWNEVARATYQHADGGQPLTPVAMMIDSGWNTKDTYQFCDDHPGVMPCKGANNDLGGNPYKIVLLQDGATGNTRRELLHVGTDYWETDLQTRLDDRLAGEPGSLTLAVEAGRDLELLTQLCNGQLKDSIDSRGNAKMLWVKKEESQANDFRDCVRYGLCLARAWLDEQGGVMPQRMEIATTRRQRAVIAHGETRPDGRQWFE